ncbi:MAG: hypothetical protein E2O83_01245 [Bacteroidetes bacterium]|nr:MAG: hypothetical protein E2O83_01245 [Bacteroidota bacterium]
MKRIFLLLFAAILAFSSCENLEDNSPALQGVIDSTFYRANDVRGQQNDDGSFTLQGINQDQQLTLIINSAQLGTYQLGEGQSNFASFKDADGNVYSTSPNGEGEIILTDRCLSCGWLTGTFRFSGIRLGIDTIAVHKGFFYQVSFLEGGLIGDGGVVNSGGLVAEIDQILFHATTVFAEEVNNSIQITGTTNSESIFIQVPNDVGTGAYELPATGTIANYTIQDITEEALSGQIFVTFFDPIERRIMIGFRFRTENHNIVNGGINVHY